MSEQTLTEQAYDLIRADTIAGRYPPGAKLKIDELRRRYDIGASPLREALARLSADGLVVADSQRGFRVAPISLDDLWDITETRVLLEGQALRGAIARGDDAWEAAALGAFHRLHKAEERRHAGAEGALDEWEARNRDFHDALVAACARPSLLRLRRQLYDQHERYRRLVLTQGPTPRDVAGEHRAILDAALARDADRAARLSDEHILETARIIAAGVAEQAPRRRSA